MELPFILYRNFFLYETVIRFCWVSDSRALFCLVEDRQCCHLHLWDRKPSRPPWSSLHEEAWRAHEACGQAGMITHHLSQDVASAPFLFSVAVDHRQWCHIRLESRQLTGCPRSSLPQEAWHWHGPQGATGTTRRPTAAVTAVERVCACVCMWECNAAQSHF